MNNCEIINDLIVGRVQPHIYAFSTNTVPNFLKVGDTYRTVEVRLNEWKKYFPNLVGVFREKATINDDVFFRDYSVHRYLETELFKHRLTVEDLASETIYYSNEFFENTSCEDIIRAIEDIKYNYKNHTNKYQYYDSNTNLPATFSYASTGTWELRPNQLNAVNNFKKAVSAGRKNLLMYAVMRFGKSFTSLCCAKEIGAKFIVVVSGKADVKEEWKKTVQQADNFNKIYTFMTSADLMADPNVISKHLNNGEGVIVFLTLQDLQGEAIKEKHKEIFKQTIDIVIIDETHFGARAEKYGEVLKEDKLPKDVKCNKDNDDFVNTEDAESKIKVLNAKIRLHLSGTPYRILMGSEFSQEDIITFCQFSDIVKEQEEWDRKNVLKDDVKEWDNPYYGFPQMIRFAFNPNKSAKKKLQALKSSGYSLAFSALFKPKSIKKVASGLHMCFENENEILDLLKVIDGSEDDDELLGFLDYDKIKNGNMCRHIVIVLPYCASCDALEKLIMDHKEEFKNLRNYTIVNISGVDQPNLYKDINSVKQKIKYCESNNKKTITLTVNRMLTGSTVEEWDTMIFLKDTASPQEYDQAIFRLQNQFIKTYVNSQNEIVRFNMKPQTLLVDFDPYRLFSMQEQKSKIYNINVEQSGNKNLENRIKEELRISPIITINKSYIHQVLPSDILHAISDYSKNKGVLDESKDLPVDISLINVTDIVTTIDAQGELASKSGLKIEAHEGEENSIDSKNTDETESKDKENNTSTGSNENKNDNNNETKIKLFESKFRTYYSRLLFYAFLSEDSINSLDDILSTMNNNNRLAHNLSLDYKTLLVIRQNINPFILSQLDYKIQNINALGNDETLSPIERAMRAISKFKKLSESEVPTPLKIASEMVKLLGEEKIRNLQHNNTYILDIASKIGEFPIAVYERAVELGVNIENIKSSILSIPTSAVAYEFTRKIYSVLGLDTNCIATKFNSYDLLKVTKQGEVDYNKIKKILEQKESFALKELNLLEGCEERMKFEAVVGNPPYQEESKTSSNNNRQNPRKNIFHHFQLQAEKIGCDSVLIFPGARWIHQSGKGLKQFGYDLINDTSLARLKFYPNSRDIFDTDIPDGISIVHMKHDKNSDNFFYEYVENGISTEILQKYPGDSMLILNPQDAIAADKIKAFVKNNKLSYLHDSVMSRSLFDIESDFMDVNSDKARLFSEKTIIDYDKEIKILVNDKSGPSGRTKWFIIPKQMISKNIELVSEWQVVVSSAHPGGQEGRDNHIEIVDNHSAFGRSRVALKSFKSKKEAENFIMYATSKIIKYAFLLTDEALSSLAKLVPDLGNYSDGNSLINYNDDIDKQLVNLLKLSEEETNYIMSKV